MKLQRGYLFSPWDENDQRFSGDDNLTAQWMDEKKVFQQILNYYIFRLVPHIRQPRVGCCVCGSTATHHDGIYFKCGKINGHNALYSMLWAHRNLPAISVWELHTGNNNERWKKSSKSREKEALKPRDMKWIFWNGLRSGFLVFGTIVWKW